MSNSNENNRPMLGMNIGAVSATVEKGLFLAHKKCILKEVSLVDISAVAASGSVYMQAQLMVDGALVGAVVDTQAGLAVREALALNIGAPLTIAEGSFVSVVLTKVSTGAFTDLSIHSDLEVKGN